MPLDQSDIKQIEGLLQPIKDKLQKIENHIKRNSDIFEYQSTSILYDELEKAYFTTCDVKTLDLRVVYDRDGKFLTDLDGCILVQQRMPNTKMNVNDFDKRVSNSSKSRNLIGGMQNASQNKALTPHKFLFVLESKNNVMKHEIDYKIDKMIRFEKLLKYIRRAKTNVNSSRNKKQFQEFLQDNHDELIQLPTCIKRFFFSTPMMPKDVQNYVIHLNNGTMTKDKYEEMTFDLFMKNKDCKIFVNDVLKRRYKMSNIVDYQSLVSACIEVKAQLLQEQDDHHKELLKNVNFCLKFCQSYDEIMVKWCVNKLGLIVNNECILSLENDKFSACTTI